MTPKYKMVTWQMLWKAFGFGEAPENTNNPWKEYCQTIADELNKLIDERCPYCEEGEKGCHCWNDE